MTDSYQHRDVGRLRGLFSSLQPPYHHLTPWTNISKLYPFC